METSEGHECVTNEPQRTSAGRLRTYLTAKNRLFVEITSSERKSEHPYSTLAKAAMDKRFVSFLK